MWSNKEEDLQLIAAEELGGDIGEFDFTDVAYCEASDRELYEMLSTPKDGYHYFHLDAKVRWIEDSKGQLSATVEVDPNGYMTNHRILQISMS